MPSIARIICNSSWFKRLCQIQHYTSLIEVDYVTIFHSQIFQHNDRTCPVLVQNCHERPSPKPLVLPKISDLLRLRISDSDRLANLKQYGYAGVYVLHVHFIFPLRVNIT